MKMHNMQSTYLVTGCTGFIGFHVYKILLKKTLINKHYEK